MDIFLYCYKILHFSNHAFLALFVHFICIFLHFYGALGVAKVVRFFEKRRNRFVANDTVYLPFPRVYLFLIFFSFILSYEKLGLVSKSYNMLTIYYGCFFNTSVFF